MLSNLADQRLTVGIGHLIPWLDLLVGCDDPLKVGVGVVIRLVKVTPGRLAKGCLGRLDLIQQLAARRIEVVAVHHTSVTERRD